MFSEKAYENCWGFASLVLGTVSLLQIKQAGLAYVLAVLAAFLLLALVCRKQDSKKKTALRFVLLAAIPALFYKLWNSYVASCNVTDLRAAAGESGQFDLSKINAIEYVATIKGGADLQSTTFWNLMRAFFEKDIAQIPWLPLSYVTAFVLVILVLVILQVRNKESLKSSKAVSMGLVCAIATAGYAFMLSVLFLFCFTADEMLELRGYERYVCSLVLGELLSMGLLAIQLCAKKQPENWIQKELIITAAAIVLFGATGLSYLAPQISRPFYMQWALEAKERLEEKTEPGSRITLIYDLDKGRTGDRWYGALQAYLQYYVNDRKFLLGNNLYTLDYSQPAQQQAAKNQIQDSDYLYFMDVNAQLNEAYKGTTAEGEIQKNAVYKVEDSGESISLIQQ